MSKEDVMLFSCYGMRGEGKSYMERLKEKDKEIERLNNIINEFNKFIENEINESKLEDNYERVDSLEYCLATLKELKGSEN